MMSCRSANTATSNASSKFLVQMTIHVYGDSYHDHNSQGEQIIEMMRSAEQQYKQ